MSGPSQNISQSQSRSNMQTAPRPAPAPNPINSRSERRKMTNQIRIGTLQNLVSEKSIKGKNSSNFNNQQDNSMQETNLYSKQ